MLQEKLSSNIEKLETFEIVVEKLRKKNRYHSIICGNFFILGKKQTRGKVRDIICQF